MRVGEIQGVEIYEESSWDFGSTIWFVQEHARNAMLQQLKKLRFKVSKHLVKTGFSIRVPYLFDAELRMLLEVKL